MQNNIIYVAKHNNSCVENKYQIVFDKIFIGNYIDLHTLAIKIINIEKPDSEFEERLIQYVDSCESLFEIADELRFENLKNIIDRYNIPLMIGVIESALNVKIIKLSEIVKEK